ncbi:unnamed protein product, partial [Amoebophrya sp. A25]
GGSGGQDSREKLHKVLGLTFDWDEFPIVRVSQVDEGSRAEKEKVVVGDWLLLFGGSQDRITLAATWEGKNPDDSLFRKLKRKVDRKDKP